MAQPSHIRSSILQAFKTTYLSLALLVTFLSTSTFIPLSFSVQSIELGTGHASSIAIDIAGLVNENGEQGVPISPVSEGPFIDGLPLDTGYGLPLTTYQSVNRTEVRTPESEKTSLVPRMKGNPISHFQSEDASFWVSNVTRVQPSSLRVYRI